MQTDVDYVLCFTHLGFTCVPSSKTRVCARTRCFKTLYGYYLLAYPKQDRERNDLMAMDSNLSVIMSRGEANDMA